MDAANLTICLIAPPILAVLLVSLVAKHREPEITSIMDALGFSVSFNPEKGLIHQGPLWLSLTIPFLYFLVLGGYAWHSYTINISAEGFKTFIQISALPLAILSSSIPLAALTSRFHSTQQTALQIATVKLKNNIDIFYAHRKAMFEYFDRIGPVNYDGEIEAKFKVHPRLHKHAFGLLNTSNSLPSPEVDFFNYIEGQLRTAREFIYRALTANDTSMQLTWYKSACDSLNKLSVALLISEIYDGMAKKSFVMQLKKDIGTINAYTISIGQTTEDLIGTYRYTFSFYRILCEFAAYDSPLIKKIDNLDLNDEKERSKSIVDGGKRYLLDQYRSITTMFSSLRVNSNIEITPFNVANSSKIS